MAFSQTNTQRDFSELNSRKILEELQIKKQLLLKQGVVSTLNATSLPVLGTSNIQNPDNSHITTNTTLQKQALQQANAQSMGFFIAQDSLFGNLILPVVPRFEGSSNNTTNTK